MAPSRRAVLHTAAAGLTAGLAGCGGLPGPDGDTGSAPRVEAIPADAAAAVHADATALLTDETLRASLNDLLATAPTAPAPTVGEALDRIESAAGLDPRGVEELLVVAGPDPPATAALAWTEYDAAEVADALGAAEVADGGVTRCDLPGRPALAALGDGLFAVGDRGTVGALIDRWNGDAPGLGEDTPLRTGYTAARGAPLQFGFTVPEAVRPDPSASDSPLAVTAASVEYGYGSLFGEDGSLVLSATAECDDVDRADRLRAQIEAGLSIAERRIEGRGTETATDVEERALHVIEATAVSRTRRTVTVQNTEGAAALAGAAAVLGAYETPG